MRILHWTYLVLILLINHVKFTYLGHAQANDQLEDRDLDINLAGPAVAEELTGVYAGLVSDHAFSTQL